MSLSTADAITWVIGAIAALLIILLLTALGFVVADSYGEFEYHTASGQTGTAMSCTTAYGQARCRTADREVVMVESYRKVK